MDYSKVLWSSFRQTDKIFHIERFPLWIDSNEQQGARYYITPEVFGKTWQPGAYSIGAFNAMVFYRPQGQTAWMPASSIVGSAGLSPGGVSVGFDADFFSGFIVWPFRSGPSGPSMIIDVVVMLLPVEKMKISMDGGEYIYGTYGRRVKSNLDKRSTEKVKWSSFDKQATIAGRSHLSFTADGNRRRVGTIAHKVSGRRPFVRLSTKTVVGFPGNLNAVPLEQYVRVWRDNTNIYVEYEPPSAPSFPMGVRVDVWWYYD